MNSDSAVNGNDANVIKKEMSTTTSSSAPQPNNGNSKKLLIIGCIIFVVIAICLGSIALIVGAVLPGLGMQTYLNLIEQAREELNSSLDVVYNQDSNSTQNDSKDSGTSNSSENEDKSYIINTSQNGELPENFPSDIPVYSNENIRSIQTNNTSIISYTTEVSAEEIFNRYKRELPSKGWEIGNEGWVIALYALTASKASREITIVISDVGEVGTSVELEYN